MKKIKEDSDETLRFTDDTPVLHLRPHKWYNNESEERKFEMGSQDLDVAIRHDDISFIHNEDPFSIIKQTSEESKSPQPHHLINR